jgi:hypothetical protein
MSTNETQESRNSGDSRRRRPRGGSNRNKNQNEDHRNNGGRRQDGNRSEEFRPQAPRPPRTYAPAKLSFLQKILKVIGLYKQPAPPSRKARNSEPSTPFPTTRAPKSNTRNARTDEKDSRSPREPREPRAPREPREKRPEGDRGPAQERSGRGNRGSDRPRGGDPKSVESTRVYVGNLSYDVTEQDLQELFKGIGAVRNVEIVYNRSTHRSKGYGFVEMLRMDEAVRCVEVLHDQPFMGRKMTVSGAKSKGQDEREDQEGRTEGEPRRVVLASAAPAVVAETVEPIAEPVIQTIVETVAVSESTEAAPQVVAEVAAEKAE